MIESKELNIVTNGDDINEVLDEAESFAKNLKLNVKQTMHIRLLTEEIMVLVNQLTGEPDMRLSFRGDAEKCCIHLEIDTWLDNTTKNNLLSVSKSGVNESAKGFLGKIRDSIENILLMSDKDIIGSEAYSNDFVMMGLSVNSSFVLDTHINGTEFWTLQDYRERVENDKEDSDEARFAYEELEKSVLANLADDIKIGIKGTHVEVDIIKNLK
ncbi:MAG: hypothetical protein K6A23_11955 [Butyrivibrio sp.]|nr:hypothetical protein [Butyrivibrio sp.]